MHTYFNFYCKPKKGQRIETTLQVEREQSAVIHGVLKDPTGEPIVSALLLLFCIEEHADTPIAQAYSDPDGHFAFWGLEGDRLYRVKLFQQNTEVRELSL